MGTYIDQTDVARRLREDLPALYDLPDQSADLDADIEAAEGIVNSYLGKRYKIPVTDATALTVVKALTMSLFEEIAWMRSAGEELPRKVSSAADTAREQLTNIAKNIMSLAGAAATEAAGGSSSAVAVVDIEEPQFTREDLEGL